jgi:hypothetical protein
MDAGSLYFSVSDDAIEVHVEEAILRPGSTQPTQARIMIYAPKVLQVVAVHGVWTSVTGKNSGTCRKVKPIESIWAPLPSRRLRPEAEEGRPVSEARSPISSSVRDWEAFAVWQFRNHTSSGSAPESPWKP